MGSTFKQLWIGCSLILAVAGASAYASTTAKPWLAIVENMPWQPPTKIDFAAVKAKCGVQVSNEPLLSAKDYSFNSFPAFPEWQLGTQKDLRKRGEEIYSGGERLPNRAH